MINVGAKLDLEWSSVPRAPVTMVDGKMDTAACRPGFISIVTAAVLAVIAPTLSLAADLEAPASEPSLFDQKYLTGNWGGARDDLAQHGIDIGLRLSQYYQGVASGGVNENGEYGATMDYRLNVDASKLGLWQGLAFSMHARSRWGDDITADAGAFVLPNAGLLMPAPGNYQGTNITGLTVSQTFALTEGLLGNVTVGQLDVIDLVTGFFPHIGYGQEGFQNVNSLVTALPWFGAVRGLSLYGGMAITINTKYQAAESGFLITGTENESTSFGSISDAFDDGVFMAGFHRFFWDWDDKMGYFMVFIGGSTRSQPSNDPNDIVIIPGQGGPTTARKNPWDVALYLYQDIWQAEDNPNRKATLLLGGTVGPDNPQFAEWNLFASLEAFGLIESRPNDRMGVAWWYNGLSNNFKDVVNASPVPVDLRDLWGVEIYYNLALTQWAHVSADLQLVENERVGNDLAVIAGGRLVVDF